MKVMDFFEGIEDKRAKELIKVITGKRKDDMTKDEFKDMASVSQISDVILGSMDEMAAGSGQISKATQQVSELALKTKDAMETINQLIGKFKV